MVFVYPLSMAVEGLSELEESALDHLESSISKTIDDGWEYVSTTTYAHEKTPAKSATERGVKAFVYRRFRKSVAKPAVNSELPPPPQPPKPLAQTERPKPELRHEEDPDLTRTPDTPQDKRTTLLTMALLNALQAHSGIEPQSVLPELRQQGEITEKQQRVLSRNLKCRRTAATIAGITPPGLEKDVFQVSLMPFGEEDDEYTSYITELAAYLDLDEAYVRAEISAKYV
ncbi:MAG: hypothetical protein AAFR73_01190 [Pseudomonadota bacterium]